MRRTGPGSALFCTILLFIATFSFAPGQFVTEPAITGDINEDGKFNVVDLVQMLIVIKYGTDSQRMLGMANLDRSSDGNVTESDMLVMLDLVKGKAPVEFYELAVSNRTGTAFVLSWRTNRPSSNNQVRYGYEPDNLDMVAEESSGGPGPTTIHFVQLEWLASNSTVYYRVFSDHVQNSPGAGTADSVSTFPQSSSPVYVNLQGTVTDRSGDPRQRVLVRSLLKNPGSSEASADTSMWFAVLTNEEGTFALNAANYRTTEGKVMNYIQDETWLHLRLIGSAGETLQDSVLLTTRPYSYQLLGTFVLDPQ